MIYRGDRSRADILVDLGVVADRAGRAALGYRAVGLVLLAAGGVLVVMLGSLIVIPRLLYPPLSAAVMHGVASAQVRIQLQQAQSQLANNARSRASQNTPI